MWGDDKTPTSLASSYMALYGISFPRHTAGRPMRAYKTRKVKPAFGGFPDVGEVADDGSISMLQMSALTPGFVLNLYPILDLRFS